MPFPCFMVVKFFFIKIVKIHLFLLGSRLLTLLNTYVVEKQSFILMGPLKFSKNLDGFKEQLNLIYHEHYHPRI